MLIVAHGVGEDLAAVISQGDVAEGDGGLEFVKEGRDLLDRQDRDHIHRVELLAANRPPAAHPADDRALRRLGQGELGRGRGGHVDLELGARPHHRKLGGFCLEPRGVGDDAGVDDLVAGQRVGEHLGGHPLPGHRGHGLGDRLIVLRVAGHQAIVLQERIGDRLGVRRRQTAHVHGRGQRCRRLGPEFVLVDKGKKPGRRVHLELFVVAHPDQAVLSQPDGRPQLGVHPKGGAQVRPQCLGFAEAERRCLKDGHGTGELGDVHVAGRLAANRVRPPPVRGVVHRIAGVVVDRLVPEVMVFLGQYAGDLALRLQAIGRREPSLGHVFPVADVLAKPQAVGDVGHGGFEAHEQVQAVKAPRPVPFVRVSQDIAGGEADPFGVLVAPLQAAVAVGHVVVVRGRAKVERTGAAVPGKVGQVDVVGPGLLCAPSGLRGALPILLPGRAVAPLELFLPPAAAQLVIQAQGIGLGRRQVAEPREAGIVLHPLDADLQVDIIIALDAYVGDELAFLRRPERRCARKAGNDQQQAERQRQQHQFIDLAHFVSLSHLKIAISRDDRAHPREDAECSEFLPNDSAPLHRCRSFSQGTTSFLWPSKRCVLVPLSEMVHV